MGEIRFHKTPFIYRRFQNIIDWTMELINKLCCQWLVYKKYLSIKPINRGFTIPNDDCKVSVQREGTFAAEGFSGCSLLE